MFRKTILMLIVLVAPAVAQNSPEPLASRIQKIIETYQPPWLPPKAELGRLVVVVDPADLGGGDDKVFALQTADHLFHLLQRGGGIPVVTRVDEAPAPDCAYGSAAALIARSGKAHAHLAIRLIASSRASGGTQLQPTGPEAVELSRKLASSLADGAKPGIAAAKDNASLNLPLATVFLNPPPASPDRIAWRRAHRAAAESIYRAIASFAQANRDQLDALRGPVSATDVPTSQPVPLYAPPPPKSEKMKLAARQIWPAGTLSPDRAPWYCELHRRVLMNDRTEVYFEPQVTVEGNVVTLAGATSSDLIATGLITSLKSLGITQIENRIRSLPDESVLDGKLFGACRALIVRTFKLAADTAGPQTQLFYGEPLLLLDRQNGFYLVHSSEGYLGWVRGDAVLPMTREQFRQYISPTTATLIRDIETPQGTLRAGTRLPVASAEGSAISLRRPEGGTLQVTPEQARVINNTAAAEQRVRAALDLLGTPYVFGARSSIGLDCSGLAGNALEQCGLSPARDAFQQFLSGKLVATRWYREDMRAGDLIYFMDESGKIFHTGIALSATHFIHSSPPEVQISCWTPGDRLYNKHWEETFLAAKRP